MENFIVSARKYRPSTFKSVVGQSSITTTLKNAIQRKQLAQAYLFCGPRGVGKTTCARIFAKTINCQNLTSEFEACNECESCKSFNSNRSLNIHELDAASNNSVEGIRKLIEQVRIPPQIGKYSVYIIDEVHMLSQSAFNAFLKTLEEPPAHAIFIMATTEKHKILPTILSRCQIFDFNRIKVEDTVNYLEYIAKSEGVEYEVEALNIIAQKADGAMRDALSIFDQVVSFSENHITYQKVIENLNVLDYQYYFRLTENFLNGNIADSLLIFDELLSKGFDALQFISGLSLHLRNLLVCHDPKTLQLLEVGSTIAGKYQQMAKSCSADFLIQALQLANHFDVTFRQSPNQRLHVELLLIKLSELNQQKKKSDVAEPSFSDKNSSPTTSSTPTVQTPVSHKPTSTSTQNRKSIPRTPSLKDALNGNFPLPNQKKDADSSNAVAEDTPKFSNEFTLEQLVKAWDNYAKTISTDKPSQSSLMQTYKPKLADNRNIIIEFGAQIHIDMFLEVKKDLLTYLKQNLKNTEIDIHEEIVIEEVESTQKLYTQEDKLKYMIEKNPALLKMKQRLNLDLG
ncbi:MAG: DNA polymerase III subunit gamma/tau [Bacteroidales bacterium]|nr:DNA polymerase III subunit gamma/tau [Bacteroidales bacterium]HPD96258.1 DNA polymerase III subunit gamma/tau [Tenuifilaceae bacterium]HRX31013.1 DNA polymerase III subunit gamma/tau [Tenuifilaceae bacterium]